MPTPRNAAKKPVINNKADALSIIEERTVKNYFILVNPATDIEERKAVVCDFFRSGFHPDCIGCDQNDDKVHECSSFYTSRIREKPMLKWNKSFSEVLIPDKKVNLTDVRGLGLGMQCNECYLNDRCPLMKKGSACQIDWGVDPLLLNDTQKAMDFLIHMQLERVGRARVHEEMDGGVPDQNLSSEMDRLAELIAAKADMNTIKIRELREVSVPGSNQSEGGTQQESILTRIFGAPKKPELAAPQQTLEVDAIVIPDKLKK